MAGMVTERHRSAVFLAQTALRAENEKLLAVQLAGFPTHADILCPAEQISARSMKKHLFGQGKLAGWPGCMRLEHRIDQPELSPMME